MGIKMKIEKNKITVFESDKIKNINIKTEPYPGFPTDLTGTNYGFDVKSEQGLQK